MPGLPGSWHRSGDATHEVRACGVLCDGVKNPYPLGDPVSGVPFWVKRTGPGVLPGPSACGAANQAAGRDLW